MIHTKTIGSGKKHLLLLHGWGQSSSDMTALGQLLSEHATIHLMDLPGFGSSPRPETCWSTFDYADAIGDWLSKNNISTVSCIGHSFGGKVAICLAASHGAKIDRIALLAASGIRSALSFKQRFRSFILAKLGHCIKFWDKQLGTDFFERYYVPQFASSDYLNATNMRDIMVATIKDDLTPHLKKVKCPTLLLWGDRDTSCPPTVGHAINNAIPQSELILFPQKNHFLLHDASSHLMARYLIPFTCHD